MISDVCHIAVVLALILGVDGRGSGGGGGSGGAAGSWDAVFMEVPIIDSNLTFSSL